MKKLLFFIFSWTIAFAERATSSFPIFEAHMTSEDIISEENFSHNKFLLSEKIKNIIVSSFRIEKGILLFEHYEDVVESRKEEGLGFLIPFDTSDNKLKKIIDKFIKNTNSINNKKVYVFIAINEDSHPENENDTEKYADILYKKILEVCPHVSFMIFFSDKMSTSSIAQYLSPLSRLQKEKKITVRMNPSRFIFEAAQKAQMDKDLTEYTCYQTVAPSFLFSYFKKWEPLLDLYKIHLASLQYGYEGKISEEEMLLIKSFINKFNIRYVNISNNYISDYQRGENFITDLQKAYSSSSEATEKIEKLT